MIAVLVATLLAGCEAPGLSSLPEPQRSSACALLERPTAPAPSLAPLEQIYARPGFERARDRDSGALRAWWAWLKAHVLALFESSAAAEYSNVTRVVVLAIALAGALGAALRLSRRRLPSGTGADASARSPLARAQPNLDHALSLVDHTPREALREALVALVSWLEHQRLARGDRTKTNRELVAELPARGASSDLAAGVARLVAEYDAAFYSMAPVSQQHARHFIDRLRALMAAGPSR